MLMKPTIYLNSELDFAVLRTKGENGVWEVFAFYNYALDALMIATGRSKTDGCEMILAERGISPILIRQGQIVDYNWMEWEVIWE